MSDAILAINASIGKEAADKVEGLEAKVRASMRAVFQGDWMATDNEGLFRAGIGGALLSVAIDSDDYAHLKESVDALRQASALISALQCGLHVDIPEKDEDARPPLPLMTWWREIRTETP